MASIESFHSCPYKTMDYFVLANRKWCDKIKDIENGT
jgi:hypothetical protein